MEFNHIRRGSGKPLLLIHGLGGNWRSWQTIIADLAVQREIIAVDLPGHGDTPPLDGETSVNTLADAVAVFLRENDLTGVEAVGSSMGARLVLELARRGGILGGVVSLNPGGFWEGWQRHAFYVSIAASVRLVRLLQPVMPQITSSAVGRTLLFPQFSARPWKLSPRVTLDEMRSYAESPVFDELLWSLAYGETQKGAPPGTIKHPLAIGWGRRDRVCFPSQSKLAMRKFPDAKLHWFEGCGHFPHWDKPDDVVQLIMNTLTPKALGGSSPDKSN